jgi:eukaryotic-like serine/threonine-protein kinase
LKKPICPDWKLHMELWTEYEGTTIDGSFPLTKLLRPEGRSAFFSTSNGNGVPRLIRLIESHFDEDEILARWRGVAALNNLHLLKLEKYGRVELDATSLVYAVMEPVDAHLGEVVSRQRLTLPETRQLASSLTSALKALHSHGFVHEHVEPASVLAVGEVVKLRSDCIRETPEGEEGRELKRRDVHDMAVVLLQAMRQTHTLETATREPLAAPFDRIVPMAINGQWGLAEIAAALGEEEPPRVRASPAVGASAAIAPLPRAAAAPESAAPPESEEEEASESLSSIALSEEDATRGDGRRVGWMVGIAVALILAVWIGWHFMHGRPADPGTAAQENSAPAPVAASAAPSGTSAPATPPGAPAVKTNDETTAGGQWRVIAYTYNRQEQAQHKAETVAQKYPELRAEVFSPSGHAPYLVAIGGEMSRDEAFALVKKVRNQGLPRDTYAQNYRSKGD